MMIKFLKFIALGSICLISSNLLSQNANYPFSHEKGKSIKNMGVKDFEDKRLCWDDSVFNRKVGLEQGGVFTAATRFDADTISYFQNHKVTKIQYYVADSPASASIKIWQGNNSTSLTEHVSQTISPEPNSWNEFVLTEPYVIDHTKELWFGITYEHSPESKPAGTDTLTNAPGFGNMVKIGDGNWTTLTTYHIQGDWNIQAILDTVIIDGYEVIFNVDMTGATFGVENESFDPRFHKVFISGTFNEWATPGSDIKYQTKLIYHEPQDGELPTTLYEGWENFEDFTVDLNPWKTVLVDSTFTWKFNDFSFPGEGSKFSFMVFNPDSTAPATTTSLPAKNGKQYIIAVQSQVPNDDKWIISPQLMGTHTSKLGFWARSLTNAYGAERIQVLVSTTTDDIDQFELVSAGDYIDVPIEWTKFEYDLSSYDGQPYYFAIRYVSEDALMLLIDDIEVTGEQLLPDEWIYSLKLFLDEGEVQYKYFVVKEEPTWEFGEWEGGENRRIIVLNDRTLNDVWGVPVGIENLSYTNGEIVKVFPNPSSDILYIEHSQRIKEVRVFDITGRMVFNAPVNNVNNTELNVSHFSNGMYILVAVGEDGVISKKFVKR